MTDEKKRRAEAKTQPRATFGGETVEARILLSATWITGTTGNDTILGTPGDDVLSGGAGNDLLIGGLGFDTADYSAAPGGVNVDLLLGTVSGADGNDTLVGIERVVGSDFDDTFRDSLGDDTMVGGAGDDIFRTSGGNDTIDGGAGRDTVHYGAALGPVRVDLTHTGAQDTRGAGIDTLSNIEGVVGSSFGDTFAFANPVDGAVYSVDGGLGSDQIDLSGFNSSAVTFSNGHLVVDMGGGKAFAIDHSNVESITFADVKATVVNSNLSVSSYASTGIYLDGNQAFRVDVRGPGSLDWRYDAASDTLTVADTTSTTSGTAVTITDLNGTDLHVGTITIDRDLGAFVSNVNVDAISINADDTTITNVTIAGGSGSLGSLSASGTIDAATTINADVGTLAIGGDIRGRFVVNGDLGSLTVGDLKGGGTLDVLGDVGNLTLGKAAGSFHVVGDVGSLSVDRVQYDVTIGGDLGTAVLNQVDPGTHVTVESVVGTLDFRVGGVQHGGTFATPTMFVFDGTTQTATTVATAGGLTPSADAGADQTVDEGDLVTLSGLASVDPESQPLTYAWVQVGGPTVTLNDASSAQPTFTAPEELADTEVKFALTVTDGVNISALDTVTITIHADNDAPTADAGADQTVDEGTVVTLTGLASSDPELQGLSYTWVQVAGPTVTLSDPNAAQPTFTAPEGLSNTAVRFQLTVSDGVNTSVDTVGITINADDDAPIADAGPDLVVDEGDVVTLDGRLSRDPEGRSLTYRWVQTGGPTVTLSDASAAAPTFTAPELLSNTALRFGLTVSDGVNSSTDTMVILVRADDDAPTVDAGPDLTVKRDDVVRLQASARDPEGGKLTYIWQQVSGPKVSLSDGTVPDPTFVAPDVATGATIVFSVGASDGTTTTYDTVSVAVAPDAAPAVRVQATPLASAGQIVSVSASATDTEGEALTYKWTQLSGTPVTFVSGDQPNASFVAPDVTRPTTLTFQVAVSDGHSTTTETVSIGVNPRTTTTTTATTTANSGGTDVPEPTPGDSGTGAPEPTAPTTNVAPSGGGSSLPSVAKTEATLVAGGANTTTEPLPDPEPTFRDLSPARNAEPETGAQSTVPTVFERVALDDAFGDLAVRDRATPSGDLVLAEAGSEVDLAPRLPEADPDTTPTWKQVAGSKVDLEATEGRVLRIRTPEVFVEEELVFEVELMSNGQRMVQEVTVQVQPVSMMARSLAIDSTGADGAADDFSDTVIETGRGLGKIWAAMLTFLTAQPKEPKR